MAELSELTGVDSRVIRRIVNIIRLDLFNKLIDLIPELWTQNFCIIQDRPGGWKPKIEQKPVRVVKQKKHKHNFYIPNRARMTYFGAGGAIETPSLDAFNGVYGGWC